MAQCVIVDSPADMCRILQSASRGTAADFARAQHEKACWVYDDQRMEFWQAVTALLSDHRDDDCATAGALQKQDLRFTHEGDAAVRPTAIRCVA